MTIELSPEDKAYDAALTEQMDRYRDRAHTIVMVIQDTLRYLQDVNDDLQLGQRFNPTDDALLAAAVKIAPLVLDEEWDTQW